MTKTALIDGDIILYSVGFASEDRYYEVKDGVGDTVATFQYASEAKDFMGEGDYTKELVREPVEPKVWKGNANSLIDKILEGSGCDEYRVFLTGKGNFRAELVDDYKANRKDVDKPLMFKEFKEWIIKQHDAETVEGIEADDELATLGFDNEDAVICTLDKDLKMVPGNHYNWVKDSLFTVTDPEGYKWFFKQLLMGDSADNIHGLHRVGAKTADKLIDPLTTAQEMYDVCAEQYLAKERTLDDMHTNGHLLWMQRTGRECTWDKYLEIET
jgi:5'-3' exonuclease